jgi:hypothetical protein
MTERVMAIVIRSRLNNTPSYIISTCVILASSFKTNPVENEFHVLTALTSDMVMIDTARLEIFL